MKNGWAEPRPEAIEWYWLSAYYASRLPVLDAVAKFAPFESVLDLGCHCGPMRRRLREQFGKEFYYLGLDCNQLAITKGQEFAAADEDEHSGFQLATLPDELQSFGDLSFDLVLSCSTLMCLPPTEFEWALPHVKRIARRAVVCQEDVGTGNFVESRGWAHAYPGWVTLA